MWSFHAKSSWPIIKLLNKIYLSVLLHMTSAISYLLWLERVKDGVNKSIERAQALH